MNEPLHYAILAGRLILGLVVGFAVWTGDAAFGQESTPAERDAAVIVENFDFPAALRGGEAVLKGVTFVKGRSGKAVYFAKGGQEVRIPLRGRLGSDQGTVEFWISLDWDPSVGGQSRQVWAQVGSITLRYDRGVRVSDMGGADTGRWPPRTWQPGEWHKVAFSWLGREIFLYVDGVRQGQPVSNAMPMSERPSELVLGAQASGVSIDNLAISDKALVKEYTIWEGWGSPAEWQVVLSDEIVTPHINFGKPSVAGKLRVLFICGDESKRQVVELAQRVDLAWSYIIVVGRGAIHPAQYPDLRRKLAQQWDVIVMEREGTECWSRLPEWAQTDIRKKLTQGVGMVMMRDTDGRWDKFSTDPMFKGLTLSDLKDAPAKITSGVPVEITLSGETYWGLKGELSSPEQAFVRTALVNGKGRVASIYDDTPRFMLRNQEELTDYYAKNFGETDPFRWQDYHWSLFGKAVRWAAGRQPALTITSLHVPPIVKAGSIPSARLVIRNTTAQEVAFTVKTTVRDLFNLTTGRTKVQSKVTAGGMASLTLKLPGFTDAGFHVVNVRLLNANGKVFDWASGHCQITSPANIAAIRTDKPSYQPGETIGLAVRFTGIEELGAKASVTNQLVDPEGRVLWQGRAHVFSSSTTVKDKIVIPEGPVNYGLWVWSRLDGDGRLLARKRIPVYVWPPEEQDYRFFMWGFGPQREFGRALRDIGVQYGMTTFISHARGTEGSHLPRADTPVNEQAARRLAQVGIRPHSMNLFPNMIRGNLSKDKESGVRSPCLTDPALLERCNALIARQADSFRRFGIRDFVLGDEMYLDTRPGNECMSPTCQAAFRDYLKTGYENLAALNEEWDTDFATWDEVKRMTFDAVTKRKIGNYAPWVDHRMYRTKVFDDFIAHLKAEFARIVPNARIGLSGMGESDAFSGVDWYRLSQTCDTIQCYQQTIELMRSFAPTGSHYTRWTGYNKGDYNEQKWRYDTWNFLFNNCKGAAWYSGTTSYALIRPDLLPRNMGRIASEEMEIMCSGLGKLLLASEQQTDPISLHYSMASIIASEVARAYPWDSRIPTHEIVEDIGMQHDYIATQQIERGDLSKYRVLILAHSLSVSRKEASEIEKFVRNGGRLIGIGAVGVTDGHGRIMPRRMLDSVFGIDTRNAARISAAAAVLRTKASKLEWDPAMTASVAESGIKPVETEVWGTFGDNPALLYRRLGKGEAIYINFTMGDYMRLRVGGVNGEMTANVRGRRELTERRRGFLRNLIARAGITPKVKIEGRKGFIASPYIETVTYTNGRSRYYGLLQKYFGGYLIKPEDYYPVRITFPHTGYLYDMRDGKFIGKTNVVDTKMVGGPGKAYAILPYKVTGLGLALVRVPKPGATFTYRVTLRTKYGRPDRHVIRMRLLAPDGKRLRLFDSNLFTKNGKATGKISLAYNEAPGEWTLVARDVVSGQEARNVLKIESSK